MSLSEPAASAGEVAVIWLKFVTTTEVAGWPPIVTVAPSSKSVPAIVTPVPPADGPDAGIDREGQPLGELGSAARRVRGGQADPLAGLRCGEAR